GQRAVGELLRCPVARWLERNSRRRQEAVRLELLEETGDLLAFDLRQAKSEGGPAFSNVHPDRHDGVHLDRGPRDFTVSLSEVNVTRREQTAVDEAGEEKGRSRDHLLDVHVAAVLAGRDRPQARRGPARKDRKSTRLNSSHVSISYAVFCLKKKR